MSAADLLTGVFFAAAKVGVLVALAGTLALTLRRAPAGARYGVWVATLVGALLLPLVTHWVPSWTLLTLAAPPTASAAFPASPASETAAPPSLAEPLHASVGGGSPCADCDRPPPGVTETTPKSWWDFSLAKIRALGARVSGTPSAAWVLGLWMAGAAVILLRLGLALASVRRLEKEAPPVEGAWLGALEEARDRVGVQRPVRLLRSSKIHTPMTWGTLRPVILLPEASREWGDERRRIVLHHELSHVRRGDWLARFLARCVCALYWLNPLVWLAGRRLVLEQEMACDEAVVALGDRPSSYARHLLAIATSMKRRSRTPTLALDMARRSQMEGRLMSILDGSGCSRGFRSQRAILIPAVLLIGLVPALAAVEPWAEEDVSQVQRPGITLDASPLGSESAQPSGAAQGGSGDSASSGDSPGTVPGTAPAVDTSGVSRVLAELDRLERQMDPYERELEAIESEMEPIEEELEGVEGQLEPFEHELEAYEAELEPFEERLEAIELELEPYEDRLEAVEAELEPYEDRLEVFESELEPYEDRLEAFEGELEPFEQRLEALENEMAPYEDKLEAMEAEIEPLDDQLKALEDAMEPLDDEMDRLDDQYDASDSVEERDRLRARMRELRQEIEPIHRKMRAIHMEMRPVHERMRSVHEEMRPVHERMRSIHDEMQPVHERMRSIHDEMQPVHERMRSIHDEVRPVHERMRSIHDEMRPVHERMRQIHEEMEPVHERMRSVHEGMQPVHEAMGEHHERMKPHHRKMREIHERMKPLHEEMSLHHNVLEQELVGLVERMLAAELGPVLPGADLSGVASDIVDDSSIRIDDGRLRILSSIPALRGFLRERFGSQAGGAAFEAAVERFLDAFSNLEIEAA
ncbi:MAG: M56 family metallopeptidase [Thermoanaerobaculia bacterium]